MNDPEYRIVNIGLVKRPNPPVRERFDEQEMERLVTSIRENGILVPILVVQRGNEFEVVDGDRRLNAAWKADLREVPVLVRAIDDSQVHVQRMLANLDRDDTDPVSEAKYVANLIHSGAFDFETISAKLGRSREWIEGRLTIAEMPAYMQDALSSKAISLGVCMELHGIADEGTKERYFREALRSGMTIHSARYNRLIVNEAIEALAQQGQVPSEDTIPSVQQVPQARCAITDELLPVTAMRMIRVGIQQLEDARNRASASHAARGGAS